MADFKYEKLNILALFQRVSRDGQRNSTEFHGMVENQSMISETGHRNMRKWEKVSLCLKTKC